MKTIQKRVLFTAALIFTFQLSYGQGDVQDLIGSRAAGAENELYNKGYHHVKTTKSNTDAYGYWWRQRDQKCICVRTNGGKIKSIVNTGSGYDCNKTSAGTANHHNNYHHTSAHHENNTHYQETQREQAYERGFKDGKLNHAYHNVYTGDLMIESYAKGYTQGVADRSRESSHHYNSGGYSHSNYIQWEDQIGRNANGAYSTLEKRGFKEVKIAHTGSTTRRIFHNADTGQCIVTISIDEEIHDIEHSENCNRYL